MRWSSLLKSLLVLSTASFAAAYPSPSIFGRSNELIRRAPDKVASGHFTEWNADSFRLNQIDWKLYNDMKFAALETRPDPSDVSLPDSTSKLLKAFVQEAHANGAMARATMGTWTGGRFFSRNVGSDQNRTAFADALLKLIDEYKLDGINFSWISPNAQGIGCNTISKDDTAKFLKFLQVLRKKRTNLIITASVGLNPFNDENGNPSNDVKPFSDVLDWVEIMGYDIFGSWSPAVGPNAPLYDSCAPPEFQQGSVESAVKAWTDAHFPASKIVVELPTYGHSFSVKPEVAIKDCQLVPYPPFDASKRPRGDEWSGEGGTDVCGNADPPGDTWNFWALIKDGLLQENGQPAPGVPYRFDNCSKTAYVYRSKTDVEISYDAPETYAAKGKAVVDWGLKGISQWEVAGDSKNILRTAALNAAGFHK